MRTICDACESAAAIVFCAADEAALCGACDEKVHLCNKLASRHVRVGLANPSDVPRCDICENAPGYKPGNIEDPASQPLDPSETMRGQNHAAKRTVGENQQNDKASPVLRMDANADGHLETGTKMIDLNMKPHRIHGQASNNQ
ncbi:hypothetical protein Goklo_020631, partial [Gossypium klotzschianum]|nr:hypothetical protein [Gossypium klotzschianum]